VEALPTETDDTGLLAKAMAGDPVSFGLLCERHRGRIWRVAASVADGREAEDLAQEAVVRAFVKRHTYRSEAGFGAWITRIAVNVAHDYRKSAWRRRVLLLGHAAREAGPRPDPACQAAENEAKQRVRQAVADLPEASRTPIWLHYFEGFSVAEVARAHGLAESTIRSRIRAGLRRLGNRLECVADLGTPGHDDRGKEADPCAAGS